MDAAMGRRNQDDVTERCEALARKPRRATIRALGEAGDPSTVDDLAAELADRLEDPARGSSDRSRIERLRIRLHHCHLPKLADAGLVTYNTHSKRVSLTETGRQTEVVDDGLELALEGV
jgi:nucleoside-diphosphate-sugar epimerase